ncbi:caspase, EACC1-associated type [Actinoplanes sp. CA-054009]
MRLPDPAHSRAVLIGASRFASMEDLPAVTNNLTRLAELLRDERVWGLPAGHVEVVRDPASPGVALEAIHQAAAAAGDTLLVYYAGHGLLDGGDELLLALPGTDKAKPFTAMRFDDVRRQVQRHHRRSAKVIILDCCYSARAMSGGMAADGPATDNLANRAAVEGSYLLVAAAETKTALAPPGETYTAFTGELVKILEEGLEDAPDLITVEQIYWRMHGELLAKGRPHPEQRARHAGASIVLTRNRRLDAPPAAPPVDDTPAVLVELPASPAALMSGVHDQRAAGQHGQADLLLQEAGRRKADQEVAGLLLLISGPDAEPVLRGASTRPVADIWTILELLREMEAGQLADDLLRAIADGAAERTVEVIAGLRDRPGAGRRLSDRLLAHAVALAAEGHPSRVIDLVSGLSVRALPDAADSAVDQAITALKGDQAATVADNLREAGRDSEAGRLYAAAIPAIVDREPEQLAVIARHMNAEAATELAVRAGRQASSARLRSRLLLAFSGAGLSGPRTALFGELAQLPEDELEPIAVDLWSHGSNEAVHLYIAASDGPIERPIRLIGHLIAHGRLRDAFHMISWAAKTWEDAELAALAATWTEPHRTGLLRRLAADVPVENDWFRAKLAGFYLQARREGGDLLTAVEREIRNRPDGEFLTFVAGLSGYRQEALAAEWLGARRGSASLIAQPAVRADLDLRRALIPVLARIPSRPGLELLVADELASGGKPKWTLAQLPAPSVNAVIAAFRDAGALRDHLASLPADEALQVLVAVAQHGEPEAIRNVLRAAGGVDLVAAALAALPAGRRAVLITAFREVSNKHRIFRLGARLENDEARLVLEGRLHLPITEASDPVATAVAEHLHGFTLGHGLASAYPLDPALAGELVALGRLAPGETCLLMLRWNLFSKRHQIVFTATQARHWEPAATPVGYRELGTLGDIGTRNRQLTFRSTDGDLPFRGWELGSAEEAAAVRELFREIQRIVRSFVSDT